MSNPTAEQSQSIKGRITGLFAREALEHLLSFNDVKTVLDVGAGSGAHAEIMRKAGLKVTTLDVCHPADEQMHFFGRVGNQLLRSLINSQLKQLSF